MPDSRTHKRAEFEKFIPKREREIYSHDREPTVKAKLWVSGESGSKRIAEEFRKQAEDGIGITDY